MQTCKIIASKSSLSHESKPKSNKDLRKSSQFQLRVIKKASEDVMSIPTIALKKEKHYFRIDDLFKQIPNDDDEEKKN